MIRYGHQLTLFRVLVTWVSRSLSGENQKFVWHDSWEKALENLKSEEVRHQLKCFHIEVQQWRRSISFPVLLFYGAPWLSRLYTFPSWRCVRC